MPSTDRPGRLLWYLKEDEFLEVVVNGLTIRVGLDQVVSSSRVRLCVEAPKSVAILAPKARPGRNPAA